MDNVEGQGNVAEFGSHFVYCSGEFGTGTGIDFVVVVEWVGLVGLDHFGDARDGIGGEIFDGKPGNELAEDASQSQERRVHFFQGEEGAAEDGTIGVDLGGGEDVGKNESAHAVAHDELWGFAEFLVHVGEEGFGVVNEMPEGADAAQLAGRVTVIAVVVAPDREAEGVEVGCYMVVSAAVFAIPMQQNQVCRW